METSRIIIYVVVAVVMGWDAFAMGTGRPTVSENVREVDAELGCLVRWMMLALWCHFFIPWGNTGSVL